MGGAPVSASATYLAQQQQQQMGGMVPSGGFGGGSSGGLPPISTALPIPQDLQQQRQQQQYGQPVMHSSFGQPSASAMHMAQAGAGGSSGGGMYGGMGSMGPPASTGVSSAAAAAAAFDAMSAGDDKWNVLGRQVAPDSPLGVVQIGGEELDVTMTFLTDHSPR
jgi:hypothetical protein